MNKSRGKKYCHIWRSFEEARDYVRSLGLKDLSEWEGWAKGPEHPKDIPMRADKTYKDKGWKCWADWLGTGRTMTNSYGHRTFEEAREYARSLGLKTSIEWFNWCRSGLKPKDIPYQPSIIYRGKGWISYGDWLGTGKKGKGMKKW